MGIFGLVIMSINMFSLYFLLLLLIHKYECHMISAVPAEPIWPDKFQVDFTETFWYPALGSHNTSGQYYYDWANRRYRIDRENGRYDRYCGFNGVKAFQNTPCSQLVLDGIRWIIYPDKEECCQCCDAAHGCGILKPTWMVGAQFLGETNGVYKWNKPGVQANYYYERSSDRKMIKIDQVPNDVQYYEPDTFQTTIDDEDDVFQLPSFCVKGNKCSFFSTCRAVGK